MTIESAEQYWQLLTELTAPVVDPLARVGADGRRRIAAMVVAAARAFEADGRVSIPGKARCVVGTKAPR